MSAAGWLVVPLAWPGAACILRHVASLHFSVYSCCVRLLPRCAGAAATTHLVRQAGMAHVAIQVQLCEGGGQAHGWVPGLGRPAVNLQLLQICQGVQGGGQLQIAVMNRHVQPCQAPQRRHPAAQADIILCRIPPQLGQPPCRAAGYHTGSHHAHKLLTVLDSAVPICICSQPEALHPPGRLLRQPVAEGAPAAQLALQADIEFQASQQGRAIDQAVEPAANQWQRAVPAAVMGQGGAAQLGLAGRGGAASAQRRET